MHRTPRSDRRLAWSSSSWLPVPPRVRRGARTALRTRRPDLRYEPVVDGTADPGEVVWADVSFEEDERRTKDRPLVVISRSDDRTVLALMLSTRLRRGRDRDWLDLGKRAWPGQRRRSFVRLDRLLELHESGLRREDAALDPAVFDRICSALRERGGPSGP